MINVILGDLRWRFALLILIALGMYALEPGFHQHESTDIEAVALGPLGVSATLSYFAGISMIVLLAGFVASERREGYTRLHFSQPTSPLAYYGLRWLIAYIISIFGALLFLVLGQLVAWGEIRNGWSGLAMPAVSALVYGGLVAFFSVVLSRGDGWIVFLLFLPTFFPQILSLGLAGAPPALRQAVLLVLPPHGALQDIWEGLLLGPFAWGATIFAASYGLIFLLAAALILTQQEWP